MTEIQRVQNTEAQKTKFVNSGAASRNMPSLKEANGIFEKTMVVNAACVDVLVSPLTTAVDIATGANEYNGSNGHRATGANTRNTKGLEKFMNAVGEVLVAPFTMLYDICTGNNK